MCLLRAVTKILYTLYGEMVIIPELSIYPIAIAIPAISKFGCEYFLLHKVLH